jgi:tetratricopeptide (TPR) repeat protein/TolB-like protein
MSTREILQSWKDISAYLGRDVRTCRRWEKHLGLPVHRIDGSIKARVFAYKDEVDRWLAMKVNEREAPAKRARHPLRRWYAVAAFTVLLAVGALGWRTINSGRPRFVPSGASPVLAVLPLVNATGDIGLNYLREAVPDHVIHDLQRSSEHLTVFSSEVVTAAVRKIGLEPGAPLTPDDLAAVASRTGAGWLLVSYLSKSGSKLRIDYELRAAMSADALKTGHVPGTGADLPMMEGRLANGVRRAFGLPASSGPDTLQACSVQATRFCEMARAIERKYSLSIMPEDLTRMIDFYNQAVEADPGCPLAHVGLGDSYQFRFVYEGRNPDDLRLMEENYRLAYEMAPERAETNVGVAWIHYLRRDNDQAYAHIKKAMEIDPDSLHVLADVGSFLGSIGVLARSAEYFTRVIKAGGGSAYAYLLRAWSYEQMGLYEAALADLDKMIEVEPAEYRTRCHRARVLILMKRHDAAAAELAMAETLAPGKTYTCAVRALAAAARGQKMAALAALEHVQVSARSARYTYYISRVCASLGMKNEALANIRLAIDEGFDEILDYCYFFPFLNNTRDYFYDKLRGDPRFIEILQSEERKYVERLEKYGGL